MNNCSQGMSPSKCVEYNSELSVYDALVKVNADVAVINTKFFKSIDGKTLGTGQDLIKTVQKLVDNQIAIPVKSISDNITVELQCLVGDTCNTVITQAQLNAILIKEMCYLKGVITNLQTNY